MVSSSRAGSKHLSPVVSGIARATSSVSLLNWRWNRLEGKLEDAERDCPEH